jgi:hypothetical protein
VVLLLVHRDPQAGPGKVRGGDEGVVPSADDHDIVKDSAHASHGIGVA